jgi:hypothetical protein
MCPGIYIICVEEYSPVKNGWLDLTAEPAFSIRRGLQVCLSKLILAAQTSLSHLIGVSSSLRVETD